VIGSGSEYGVEVRYVTEANPLGTAGAYKHAVGSSKEPTVVVNGDVITDINLNNLLEFHRSKGSAATLALVQVDDPSRYGRVTVDKNEAITSFIEKPSAPERAKPKVTTINAGIYVLEPGVLDMIPKETNRSFEYEVFPQILEKNLPFFGYVIKDEYWRDIGTPETYLAAHHDLLSGKVQGFELAREDRSEIATRAEVDKVSVIDKDCVVKPGARIVNSVLGPGVHIEEKAVIENSVIWAHTRVAAAAEIADAVIGRNCHIGRNAVVGPGAVLGDKTSLTDYTRV